MATKGNDAAFLQAERPGYENNARKKPKKGWDGATQTDRYHDMFDGLKARPYTAQLRGSPKARAKSGPRSLHAWQRDYNPKGLIDEKANTMRYQRVVELKKLAVREAFRRQLPVEAVHEEISQAQRAAQASKRVDTGLRKVEMTEPSRTYPSSGGQPRLFDGGEVLEESFLLKDAQDMFRGEAWEAMSDTLAKLHEFNPPPRSLEEAQKKVDTKMRGSFSAGVTPAELSKAMALRTDAMAARTKARTQKAGEWSLGAGDLESLKKLLVRKYGTITAAWRHVLDLDGNGKLSFAEWSKALRVVGFEGNIKATYRQLDGDHSGIVTFDELEPELGYKLKDFKTKILCKHGGGCGKYGGNWDEVWKAIDDNGNNQLDPDEFAEVCVSIGYEGSPIEIFKQLRSDASRKFLNLEDFKAIPKGY